MTTRPDWREVRAFKETLAKSSVGVYNEQSRAFPNHCPGPRNRHVPSDAAVAAEVVVTRCIVCRQRIELTDGEWWAVATA